MIVKIKMIFVLCLIWLAVVKSQGYYKVVMADTSTPKGEQADGVNGPYTPSAEQIMVICRLYDDDGVVDLFHLENILYALGFDADKELKSEVGQPGEEKVVFITLQNMKDLVESALQKLIARDTQKDEESGGNKFIETRMTQMKQERITIVNIQGDLNKLMREFIGMSQDVVQLNNESGELMDKLRRNKMVRDTLIRQIEKLQKRIKENKMEFDKRTAKFEKDMNVLIQGLKLKL